jgi:hypothetical protein
MYCVYLTIYSGNLLPPYYIGSTSLEKYNKGYKGSVSSKKYKTIWKNELKNHSELFDVLILDEFNTRQEALNAEYILQKKLNVVKSDQFINLTFAGDTKCFGTGWNKGISMSDETKEKISLKLSGRKIGNYSKDHCNAISTAKKGKSNGHLGKFHSDDTKLKMSNSAKGRVQLSIMCPHCKKTGGANGMVRYHFNNCKEIK